MVLTAPLACGLGASGSLAGAQDGRTVTEPHFPPVCKVLTAELTPIGGGLPDGVERHYRDTPRVEKAMRHCGPGTSVVLRAGGAGKTVFLLGPTRLSAGVTLVVEADVAIWGSRDPRNYDVEPGSCTARGKGSCRPLIVAWDAPGAGLMGEGVIDGRGGTRLLLPDGREGGTWWELAHAAHVEGVQVEVPQLVGVRRSNDFVLYRLGLRNSPGAHVLAEATAGLTAWSVVIEAPPAARGADGIELGAGTADVSLVETTMRTGGAGLVFASGTVSRVTARGLHLIAGQGIAIEPNTGGDLGAVLLNQLSIDGADRGLTIVNHAGKVSGVTLSATCLRGVAAPVSLTADGSASTSGIVLRDVHALAPPGTGTALTFTGADAAHRLALTLDNLVVDGIRAGQITSAHVDAGVLRSGNVRLAGRDVHVTGAPRTAAPYTCAQAFPSFPLNGRAPISAQIVPVADKP